MGKKFKSVGELESYIKENITDVLTAEVLDESLSQLYTSSENIIYKAYNPWTYTEDSPYPRRHTWSKEESYQFEMIDDLTLQIIPEAEYNHVLDTDPNYGNEALGIYYGLGNVCLLTWAGHPDWEYKQPRPWLDDASEKIDKKILKSAMKKGLQARGISAR